MTRIATSHTVTLLAVSVTKPNYYQLLSFWKPNKGQKKVRAYLVFLDGATSQLITDYNIFFISNYYHQPGENARWHRPAHDVIDWMNYPFSSSVWGKWIRSWKWLTSRLAHVFITVTRWKGKQEAHQLYSYTRQREVRKSDENASRFRHCMMWRV